MKTESFKLIVFLLLFTFFGLFDTKAQTIWECETVGPPQDLLKGLGITTYNPQLESVTIRFYVHVIRRSDGTGGLNPTQVENAVSKMESDFLERNIYFYKIGESSINSDTYFNFTGTLFNSLIQVNSHNDAVDIYLLPSNIFYGRASDIPGIALVLGGAYAGTSVLSHEMGHCLGLWHTHSGRGCGDFANCAEEINGSNCTECGDLVCDTPADPCLSGNVNSQCQYIGPSGFNPDIQNIMSYTPPFCMDHLTTGQFDRMFVMIENSSILQNVIQPTDVLVTIDQRNSLNQQVGVLRKWEGSNWSNSFNPGTSFDFTVNSEQTILGDQTIIGNQKYNNWNEDFSDVKNHHTFTITTETNELTSRFIPTHSGVTVKNVLEGTNVTGGTLAFRDPWFIDYPDPAFGNQKRNRGMDNAEWYSRTSPFYPDYTTSYNGDVYRGVFLDQFIEEGNPYYKLWAGSQLINLGSPIGVRQFYFQNWTSNQYASLETFGNDANVVFTDAGAEVYANFKGIGLSNQTDAYNSNSQRKFVRTDDGWLHNVYESMGRVWYETSSDNGVTWTIANNGKPLDNGEGKLPSIAYSKKVITPQAGITWNFYQTFIVFQEKSGNGYKIKLNYFQRFVCVGCGGDDPTVIPRAEAELGTGDDYSVNAQPVIGAYKNSVGYNYFTAVWKNSGGLYARSGHLNMDSVNEPFIFLNNGNYLTTSPYSINPTISYSGNTVHKSELAWEENNSIKYAALSGSQISGSIITLSSNTGFSHHYNPSIIEMPSNSARVCWVGFRMVYPEKDVEVDAFPQYKVLFKSPQNPGSYWQFGNNVSSPNINKKSDNTYYAFAWSEDLSTIKFADNTLSTVRTISDVTGQNLQINNGPDNNNMFCMAFEHNAGAPFYFERSNYLGSYYTPQKITSIYFSTGREGTVSVDSASFYFALGDISVDGETIDFIAVPDSVLINSLSSLNEYLITEQFNISDNSDFIYSVQFGLNDSLSALQSITGSRFINFKVQLIDNSSGSVLGEYDNITYDSENLFQYNNLSYQVNTQGIGNKTVRLKLIADNNFNVDYSLSQIYADTEVLGKSSIRQISFNGGEVITSYELYQNYPNPFNPSTTIRYQVPEDGVVTLKIYDILGKEVTTLVNEQKTAGKYELNFDASSLASGVYIYRIQVNDFTNVKKMMLLK